MDIRRGLFAGLFGLIVLAAPLPLLANPGGVGATSGLAAANGITGLGTANVQVNQAATHAVINWNDFSIGAGELVQFNQPSATAAILNRVTGGNLSQIYGQMKGNGRVLLVNPAGIFFAQGSQVDVAGLVASTLDITDANFNADHWQFDGVPDGSVPGRVSSAGTITAAAGGFVALLSQGQQNSSGTINAPQGSILLANGSSIFVDPVGDGLMLYQVSAPTPSNYDANGDGTNDAGNDGIYVAASSLLAADGGRVAVEADVPSAQAANQISAVITQGVIRARAATTGSHGEIILVGRGSDAYNAGLLDASGPGNGTVTLRSDTGVSASPPQNLYPCNQNPNPCTTGDGNNPPLIQARNLVLDGVGSVNLDGVTLAVQAMDVTSGGYASFSGDTFSGLQSVTGHVGELDIFNSDISAPALTFNITGGLFFGGSRLSGNTLNAQASDTLSVGNQPNVPSVVPSSLSFTQQVTLGGVNRINLIGARVDTPALALNTGGIASIDTDQFPQLRMVTGTIGELDFFTSTVTTPDLSFDITGNLFIGGATLSGSTLTARASGNLSIGDEPNVPGPPPSSHLSYGQQIQLAAPGRVNIINATLDTPTLIIATSGYASMQNDQLPNLRMLQAQALQLQLQDMTLNLPALDIDVAGGLLMDGVALSGGSLTMAADGFELGPSLSAAGAARMLDYTGTVSIDSRGGALDILGASVKAGDLKISGSGYVSIDNSMLQATHGMQLSAGADLQFDVNTSPQSTTQISAGSFAARAGGTINLANAVVDVGTEVAAFGEDDGMIGELRDVAPDRVPLAAGPDASFAAPHVVIGNITLQGDYLYLQTNSLDFTGPLPINAPTDLLVNVRPYGNKDTLGLEQDIAYRRTANFGVNQQLNNAFPGTTYIFGGTDYDGVIFAGEAGPIDFGSHDAGVLFMTNGAVAQEAPIQTSGPQFVLAGLTSAPPEADEDQQHRSATEDDDNGGKDHEVDRVTSPAAAKECR
ncbi:MAG TPA: filamentous hemagglutinin N-terminal domain-containing protein [Nevskiaceae bacterium]|nr:filamentous hemagglutinin N-terminal domain-containing protein [Nevskiaceae bacterium]